jgi:hypothetical protein
MDPPFDSVTARLSQKSFEWHTPAKYVNAARRVMNGIELDPASCELANMTIKAGRYFDIASDGLTQKWTANSVWLNPPYCKSGSVSNQELWTCKLIAEYEAGNTQEAILLVNAATETAWFQRLYAYPVCFVKGRIHFNSPTGVTTGPTTGQAFIYFGSNAKRFISVFSQFGKVVQIVQTEQQQEKLFA